MTSEALADRLIVYSDTVVAFCLVNGFAFLITLSDPDIRCSIAAVAGVALVANVVLPIGATWALFWLRGFEGRLRAASESAAAGSARAEAGEETGARVESADADGDEVDALVSGFWRRLFVARLVLIWLSAVVVLVGVYGATRDTRCVTEAVSFATDACVGAGIG